MKKIKLINNSIAEALRKQDWIIMYFAENIFQEKSNISESSRQYWVAVDRTVRGILYD